jgi:hypothetical protein
MGDVYRARDTRLPRDVALKLLRGTAADVPERVRRFQQEAHAASSLNHPNIVVVYEAGEAVAGEGQRPIPFLAMEMVPGQPLGSVLITRELSTRAVLDLMAQIADGLARAHESGIVHRDLKPSNLLVTPDGLVKIVDFGLAKLHLPSDDSADARSGAETESAPGIVLGTPAYMSPEQARGEDAGPASDQFAFGCVMYEMLTGRRPFSRASDAETISALLRDEPPPIEDLRPETPPPLRWLVERCLSKEPRDRYDSTRDLARDLRTLRERLGELGSPAAAGVTPGAPPAGRLNQVLAGCLLVALTAAMTYYLSKRMLATREPEFRRLTFQQGNVFRALFVPRSNAVLHTASWNGQPPRTFTMLPEASGLDRSLEAEPQLPMAFSEDGSEVLVLLGASRPSLNARGTLAVWPAVGGRPRPIVDDAGWGDWAGGGRLVVFVRDLGAEHALVRREAGDERTLFRTAGALSYVRVSQDRTDVAFIHHASRGDDAGEVRVMPLDGSGEARPLTPIFERCFGLDWNARTREIWFTAASAHHHGTTLLAVDGSGRRRTLYTLPETAVLESVSPDGERCLLNLRDDRRTLAVRQGQELPRDLTWLGMSLAADVSPDGRMVAFWDGGASERSSGTWLRPLEGTDAVRLGDGEPKRFSDDGRSLVAVRRTAGRTYFLLIPVGAGTTRSLAPPDPDSDSPSFSGPDALLFIRPVGGRKQVWRMQLDGSGARSLGLDDCTDPMTSPSGDSFLAICGGGESALEIHSITGRPGRRLFELPPDDQFVYARWNKSGDRVFGLTMHRRFVTLDSSSGRVLAEERLPPLGKGEEADLLDAGAVSANGSVQAYSAGRISSRLYVAEGIR